MRIKKEHQSKALILVGLAVATLLFFTSCSTLEALHDGAGYRAISVGLGQQKLTDGDNARADSTRSVSATLVYGPLAEGEEVDPLPVGWMSEMSLRFTEGNDWIEGFDVDHERLSLDLGLRHYFRLGSSRIRPYLGGGVTVERAEVDVRDIGSEDDWGAGLYGRLGATWFLGENWHLDGGILVTEGTSFDFGDFDTDLDSSVLYLSFGVSF